MRNVQSCWVSTVAAWLMLADVSLFAQNSEWRAAHSGSTNPNAKAAPLTEMNSVNPPRSVSDELFLVSVWPSTSKVTESLSAPAAPMSDVPNELQQRMSGIIPPESPIPAIQPPADTTTGALGKSQNADSRAGRPTINIGGRFDFDNAWYTHDRNLQFGNSDNLKLDDGASIRRVNLQAFGDVMPWLSYTVELNFTNIAEFGREDTRTQIQSLGLGDTYLTIRFPPLLGNQGEVKVGHIHEPFSLERMSSSDAMVYFERSPGYDALLNPVDYSDGFVVSNAYLDQRLTLAASFARVGQTINPFGFGAGDGRYGTACRITGLPVYKDDGCELVHLGAAVLHRAVEDEPANIGSRALIRGGAGASQTPNVIQTQDGVAQNGATLFGLEAAIVNGPFSVSGEYMFAWVHDIFENFDGVTHSDPRGTGFYPSAYVEMGYFLTSGTHRRYDKKKGAWDRTIVADPVMSRTTGEDGWRLGGGAWEVVGRYTYLDLRSPEPVTLRPAGAQPGVEHDMTLGLAWHLNTYSRVMMNYVYTRINSEGPTTSGDIHALGIRFHVDF